MDCAEARLLPFDIGIVAEIFVRHEPRGVANARVRMCRGPQQRGIRAVHFLAIFVGSTSEGARIRAIKVGARIFAMSHVGMANEEKS